MDYVIIFVYSIKNVNIFILNIELRFCTFDTFIYYVRTDAFIICIQQHLGVSEQRFISRNNFYLYNIIIVTLCFDTILRRVVLTFNNN